MLNNNFPKITFGIIVLNGEPFTRYCLRSIYPYAHEIIVVEGGHQDTKSVTTPDGHSIDGTLESLNKFKQEEDYQNKLTIITRNGFWPKTDEMGNHRTPQCRAYAEKATGDYLWQIDIDEFYKASDMQRIIKLLQNDASISSISFKQKSFWGSIDYISDSIYLRRNSGGWHRIFKWGKNYKYLTHEPPTILDEKGIDMRSKHWLRGEKMARKDIFMYHYCLLFPWQVEQKVKIYRDEKPEDLFESTQWAENNFFRLGDPYRVHNVYRFPSWLIRYNGEHPEQITHMMKDIKEGKLDVKLRRTDDVEAIIDTAGYKTGIAMIKIEAPLKQFVYQIKRIKNIPNRIRKVITKYSSR